MISNDLANLADRLLGHAQHSKGPSPVECSRIAAELRKLSQIVATMEGMPIVMQALEPEFPMEPNTLWVAVSPGVLELPTTKFRITYRRDWGLYILSWDNNSGMAYGNLSSAKEGAAKWMASLIETGIEV